jgi:cation/acetate symporter
MAAPVYAHIRNNPKFQQLVTTRSRFAWLLCAVVLVVYYGFMAIVAFNPTWLAQSVGEGRIATIGWPIAAAMMVLFWVLTGLYVVRANGKFDAVNAELIKEATKEAK